MPSSTVLERVCRFVLLATSIASGLGCHAVPSVEPCALSFRPTPAGASLWLATPIAVEVKNEHEARELEAAEPLYVGEIGVSGGRLRPALVALYAARHGATHFRVVSAGEELRVDVILFRLDPERWPALPEPLRPASPAASAPDEAREEPRASL